MIASRSGRCLRLLCALIVLGVAPAAPVLAQAATAAVTLEDAEGSGLAEAPPADGYRTEIERAWFTGGESLSSRASAARMRALRIGAANADAPARALIAPGGGGGGLGEALLAVKLSPDLPLAHLAVARVHWDQGERSEAASALVRGFLAVPRNLEASLWLAASLLVMATIVLALGALVFMALAGLSVYARAAHDLGDLFSKRMPAFARAGLLGVVLALPALFGEGIGGLALGLFGLGIAYGGARHRMALVLAAALLLIALNPVARVAGRLLATLDSDPAAAATLAVMQGVQNDADVGLLEEVASDDSLAALALAVHARRTGRLDEAFHRYHALRERTPRDPVVMTNLANLQFQRGEIEEATALYERATELLDSPVLWFDLSQAYARTFKMEEFEDALRRGQALDSGVVAELSQQEDPNLLADLPIPMPAVRARLLTSAAGDEFARWLRAPLLPGRLGEGWHVTAMSFAAMAGFWIVLAGAFEHASACRRCGRRICARCDGTVWNSVTCDSCHRLFNHPESTDTSLRMVRLGELRDREVRVERFARWSGLLVPGIGGMNARRPDLAFIGILLFLWVAAAIVWRAGVVPDPLVLGATGPLFFLASALLAGCGYLAVVLASLSIRRNL